MSNFENSSNAFENIEIFSTVAGTNAPMVQLNSEETIHNSLSLVVEPKSKNFNLNIHADHHMITSQKQTCPNCGENLEMFSLIRIEINENIPNEQPTTFNILPTLTQIDNSSFSNDNSKSQTHSFKKFYKEAFPSSQDTLLKENNGILFKLGVRPDPAPNINWTLQKFKDFTLYASTLKSGDTLDLTEYWSLVDRKVPEHDVPVVETLNTCLNTFFVSPLMRDTWRRGKEEVFKIAKLTPYLFIKDGKQLKSVYLEPDLVNSDNEDFDNSSTMSPLRPLRKIDRIKKIRPKDMTGNIMHYSMRRPMFTKSKNVSSEAYYTNPRCDLGEKHTWSLMIVYFTKEYINLQPNAMNEQDRKLSSLVTQNMRDEINDFDYVQDKDENLTFKRILFTYLTGLDCLPAEADNISINAKFKRTEDNTRIGSLDSKSDTESEMSIKICKRMPEDLFSVKNFVYKSLLEIVIKASSKFRHKLLDCLNSAGFNKILVQNKTDAIRKLFDRINCREYPYSDVQHEQAVKDFKKTFKLTSKQ